MGQPCSACEHPDREAIDAALVGGSSLRDVAGQFEGVSRSALHRHRQHISNAIVALKEARSEVEGEQAGRLLDRVEGLAVRLERLVAEAERGGKAGTLLQAARELRSTWELVGKLTGELRERPSMTVNILATADWLQVRTALFEALSGHPEARAAVAGRLLELEAAS